ncbi:hypothetical protein AVEN_64768-1 [Araneus ventricosus]|uniref:Reverse transcriptase domain-containing protein n=1 Tax=Araneus ventricosus TaxID=182803 RepID=A0A4Y2NA33_ARAVE|nr:hypothetical protein AVEN_64768-1 [Araneus ventricosus]
MFHKAIWHMFWEFSPTEQSIDFDWSRDSQPVVHVPLGLRGEPVRGWHREYTDELPPDKEGKSCEIAINNIVTRLKENREIQLSALVSLDTNSAFDSLDWSVLFRTLDSYGIAKCFRNFIFHYLVDRKVIFDDGLTRIERVCTMGCPQGSVISLCLWNIYINPILKLNSEKFLIQAFADDLALVSTGRTRRELETNTNEILEKIMENLLLLDKCRSTSARQSLLDRNKT